MRMRLQHHFLRISLNLLGVLQKKILLSSNLFLEENIIIMTTHFTLHKFESIIVETKDS